MTLLVFADLDVPAQRQAEADGFQKTGDQSSEIVDPPLIGNLKEQNQNPRDEHGDGKSKDSGGEKVQFFRHVVVDLSLFFRVMTRVTKYDHAGQKQQKKRINKADDKEDRHERLAVRIIGFKPNAVIGRITTEPENFFRAADRAHVQNNEDKPQHKPQNKNTVRSIFGESGPSRSKDSSSRRKPREQKAPSCRIRARS